MTQRGAYRIGILTLGEGGVADHGQVDNGEVLKGLLEPLGQVRRQQRIEGSYDQIVMILKSWIDELALDLILTIGGTGLRPQDQMPQATAAVVDFRIEGLAESMRAATVQKYPAGMLSRALAGVRGQSLIVNLPNDTPGVLHESLDALLPALSPALAQLREDARDSSCSGDKV